MKRLLILASGRGTHFQNLVEQKIPDVQIVALLTDKSDAPVVERAKRLGVPVHTVALRDLGDKVEAFSPDYIVLAGFMRILEKKFVERWTHRILNIHPSLLPAFKGLHPQRQALEYGARWTGCTVHLVDATVDGGPILAQTPLAIEAGDTEKTLSERLLPVEHKLYAETIRRVCAEGFTIQGRTVVWGA